MSVSTCQSNDQLTKLERQYVVLTQQGIPVVKEPYQWIADKLEIGIQQCLDMTNDLLERGIIRRIAVVPNHYKLGYKFNGMTVWDVDDNFATEMGKKIGQLPFVSHCYLRPRHLPEWNYNLFAMIHGKNQQEIDKYRDQIKTMLQPILQTHGNISHDMLTSSQILKKTGLRLKSKAKVE